MNGKLLKNGFGLLTCLFAAPRAAFSEIQRLWLSGEQPAPGMPLLFVAAPAVNDFGQLAFRATVGSPDSFDWTAWAGDARALRLIESPADAGTVFEGSGLSVIFPTRIDDFGNVAYRAFYVRDQQETHAVRYHSGGTTRTVLRVGDAAPGVEPPTTIHSLADPYLSPAGHLGIEGNVPGLRPGFGTTNEVRWVGTPDALRLVARAGDPAPHVEPGLSYAEMEGQVINRRGEVVAFGRVQGPGVYEDALWYMRGIDAPVELLARRGQVAPGTGGLQFATFTSFPSLASDGRVGFNGSVTGAGVGTDNDWGAWVGRPGSVEVLVREGQAAPGAGDGAVFQYVGDPSISSVGAIATYATIRGPGVTAANDSGVWLWRDGQATLLMREGEPAPGLPPGVNLGRLDASIAEGGYVLVRATLTGEGVSAANQNDRAAWLLKEGQAPQLVARSGDRLRVAEGDERLITALGFALVPTSDGRLPFRADFADGTQGSFLFHPEAVQAGWGAWRADADGEAGNSANWSGGVPSRAGDVAIFGHAISAPRTVTVSAPLTLGGLRFGSEHSYTIAGQGPVRLEARTLDPGEAKQPAVLDAVSGQHTLSVPLIVADDTEANVHGVLRLHGGVTVEADTTLTKRGGGTLDVSGGLGSGAGAGVDVAGGVVSVDELAGGGVRVRDGAEVRLKSDGPGASTLDRLTVDPGGVFDVVDRELIVRATATTKHAVLEELAASIRSARNAAGGRWSGSGLTSSAARGNALTGLGIGFVDDDVLVKYTYNGDANLDGRINADDYFRIDQAFLAQPASPTYAQGDFNYDGRVNADDYFLIDQAFLGQGPRLAGSAPSALAPVPEPSGTALIFAAGILLRRRRRPATAERRAATLKATCSPRTCP